MSSSSTHSSDAAAALSSAFMRAEDAEVARRIARSKSLMEHDPFEVTLRITREDGSTTTVPTHFPDQFAVYRGGYLETTYGAITDARFWCTHRHLAVTSLRELPRLDDVVARVAAFRREHAGRYVDDGPPADRVRCARPIPASSDAREEIDLEAECPPTALRTGDTLHVHTLRRRTGVETVSPPYTTRAILAGAIEDFRRRTAMLASLEASVRLAAPGDSLHVSTTTHLLRGTLVTVCDDAPTGDAPVLHELGLVRVVGDELAIGTVIARRTLGDDAGEAPRRCAACGVTGVPTKRCERCVERGVPEPARYCSEACQLAHWPAHRAWHKEQKERARRLAAQAS